VAKSKHRFSNHDYLHGAIPVILDSLDFDLSSAHLVGYATDGDGGSGLGFVALASGLSSIGDTQGDYTSPWASLGVVEAFEMALL